jgi:hypothetical protein
VGPQGPPDSAAALTAIRSIRKSLAERLGYRLTRAAVAWCPEGARVHGASRRDQKGLVGLLLGNPGDPGAAQRLRYEAEILRRFSHPNVLRLVDCGEVDGEFYLAVKNDSIPDTARKAEEYLTAGVRVVWVADPIARNVTEYRQGAGPRVYGEGDTLTVEDVIPGFQLSVREAVQD